MTYMFLFALTKISVSVIPTEKMGFTNYNVVSITLPSLTCKPQAPSQHNGKHLRRDVS